MPYCNVCDVTDENAEIIHSRALVLDMCRDCYDDNITTCSNCGLEGVKRPASDFTVTTDYPHLRGYSDNEGNVICHACARRKFWTCYGCRERVNLTMMVAQNGSYRCQRCTLQRRPKKRDKSSRPPVGPLADSIITPGRIICKRYYGVELETTNAYEMGLVLERHGFTVVGDSSVCSKKFNTQDLGMGGEIVTPPLLGDGSLAMMRILSEQPLQFDSSCGTHLHLDVRDLSPYELMKVVYAAILYEPIAKKLCTPARYTVSFCKPISRSAQIKEQIELLLAESGKTDKVRIYNVICGLPMNAVNATTAGTQQRPPMRGGKYHLYHRKQDGTEREVVKRMEWFSIHDVWFRGTIEIRHLEGTNDYKTLKNWIWLWQHFLDKILRLTFAEIRETPFSELIPAPIRSFWLDRTKKGIS